MAKYQTALGFNVVTPQFTRPLSAAPPAAVPEDWEALRSLNKTALRELGLRAWDAPDDDGFVLMLLPGEWYSRVPAGFEVVDINGVSEKFEPGITDNDIRFGCLAYGIRVKAE